MKKSVVLCMVILLNMIALFGCQHSSEEQEEVSQTTVSLNKADRELIHYNNKAEINDYMGRFMSDYISDERLEIEKRPLMGESSEGGEITRYRDSNGAVLRYRMIYYGEMGRTEDNYYFIHKDIYYTRLVENYSSPIYVKETEVMNREFKEIVWSDGVEYQYDTINKEFLYTDTWEIPYSSLEEMNDIFLMAGAKADREGDFSNDGGSEISPENQLYRNELEKYLVRLGYTEDFQMTRMLKSLSYQFKDNEFVRVLENGGDH